MHSKLIIMALGVFAILPGIVIGQRSSDSADKKFEALAERFLERYLELEPEAATQLGDHRYDSKLNDYSREGVASRRAFDQEYLKELATIPMEKLSPENSVDYRILRTKLEGRLFQIDALKDFEWNPLSYNVSGSIYALVARDFAPLDERLNSVKGRLEGIAQVCAEARKNLKNPPRVYTETAITQNQGSISLVREGLEEFIAAAPGMKAKLATAQANAISALEDYGKWLSNDLLPRSNGEFRIGDEKFRAKLKFSLESDLSKEEILKRAEADLKATQETMYNVALPLYRKFFPAETDATKLSDRKIVIKGVLDRLATEHPTNDTIVDLAREDLRMATDFVRDHSIVTLPTEPVKAIVMPEYARGVAVAYCDSSGPLEKHGQTFFDISPTPKDWTAPRVDSFFREYNNFMVQDLTVHEAMPGHYLQLAHAAQFHAPTKIRAVFDSGVFIEGWAVYAEEVMGEAGYGGPEVRMQQLKMRLRSIINAILDQKIHTAGMTEEQAIGLMKNEGFQEEGEAVGKWKRAQLSSTQLSTYFVGVQSLIDIRRAYEARQKGQIDLKRMHDLMLSFGSPAPKYVKELMGL